MNAQLRLQVVDERRLFISVNLVNWGTGDTCRLQDDKQKTTPDNVRRLPEISPRRYRGYITLWDLDGWDLDGSCSYALLFFGSFAQKRPPTDYMCEDDCPHDPHSGLVAWLLQSSSFVRL